MVQDWQRAFKKYFWQRTVFTSLFPKRVVDLLHALFRSVIEIEIFIKVSRKASF